MESGSGTVVFEKLVTVPCISVTPSIFKQVQRRIQTRNRPGSRVRRLEIGCQDREICRKLISHVTAVSRGKATEQTEIEKRSVRGDEKARGSERALAGSGRRIDKTKRQSGCVIQPGSVDLALKIQLHQVAIAVDDFVERRILYGRSLAAG
jgi:hypothetical protein